MSNIFDLYSGQIIDKQNQNGVGDGKIEYAACLLSAEGQQPKRLALYLHNGVIQMPAYTSLAEVFVFSHEEISLIFDHSAINIQGEYLYEIVTHLQYERVESLGCFIEEEGWIRPKKGQPLINTIEHETLADFYFRHHETDENG